MRLHLVQPSHRASDGYEGLEGRGCFPDAEHNSTEAFDLVEKTLDQVAFLVDRPVDGAASRAASVALDLRLGLHRIGDEVPQRFGVIAGIRHDMADALEPGDQPFGLRAAGPLPGGEVEAHRQTKRVDGGMDLRRQPTPGPTDRTSLKPPF